MKDIKTKIKDKQQYLLRQNKRNLNLGDRYAHTCVCNELKGMNWVLELLRRRGFKV